jgi:hypothetical protein
LNQFHNPQKLPEGFWSHPLPTSDEQLWIAIAISAAHTAICIEDVTNVADGVVDAFRLRFRQQGTNS